MEILLGWFILSGCFGGDVDNDFLSFAFFKVCKTDTEATDTLDEDTSSVVRVEKINWTNITF